MGKENSYKFTKSQLVKSVRYANYTDFLSGNLEDGKMYTFEEVEKLINDFYGKKGE